MYYETVFVLITFVSFHYDNANYEKIYNPQFKVLEDWGYIIINKYITF